MLAELFHKELPSFNSTGKDVKIEFANSIFLKVNQKSNFSAFKDMIKSILQFKKNTFLLTFQKNIIIL